MPEPYRSDHDNYLEHYLRSGEAKVIGADREVQGKRKDGTIFTLDLSLSEVKLGERTIFSGIVRDVTERKSADERLQKYTQELEKEIHVRTQLQQELDQAKHKLELILDSVNEGIYMLDTSGAAIFANHTASKMCGFSLEEMKGKTQHQLIHHTKPDGTPYILDECPIYKTLTDGMASTVDSEIFWHKNGHSFPVEYTTTPFLDKGGKIIGAVISFRDISEQKYTEEQLSKALSEAERATRLKSEFLANMSHEIRTPMNGILGMSHLLLDTALDAKQRSYANTVINSSEALLQIINDILDFSKIEAGKMELENIPFDLQLLAEEVADLMAVKAHEKHIELLLRFAPGTSRYVIGDAGRVRQIFLNLVGNAIKFTDQGHVLLSIESSMIGNTIHYRVHIEDTGIGIPSDKLYYIFNKFTQADGSTTRKFGGTGLGLAICKQLVQMMAGDIGVESTLGSGSVFWFTLALPADTLAVKSPLEISVSSLRGCHFLVVDDNKTARTIIMEQLQSAGAIGHEASSGKNAIEILHQRLVAGEAIQLAVLDYMMEGMDGCMLAQHIKNDPVLAHIPLVMLTSSPARGDSKRLHEMGFSGYLPKPLNPRELLEMLTILHVSHNPYKSELLTRYNLMEYRQQNTHNNRRNIRFDSPQILLVEDNAVNQQVATAMLVKSGCVVASAKDGEEAVNLVKQKVFDLVFMDCQMPVMDGYEATMEIRQREKTHALPRLPIIALTANAMKGDDKKCFAAGMDDYLTKPMKQHELEDALL